MIIVVKYIGDRPMAGISLKGANSNGPTPYPKTYRDSGNAASVGLMVNFSITCNSDTV